MFKKGFTLIELVMVIVIISVLAAIIVPKFVGQREQAQIAETKANLQTLRTAVQIYYTDSKDSKYPASLEDLTKSAGTVSGTIYMSKIPTPSVGGSWDYPVAGKPGEVKLTSGDTDVNGQKYSDY